MEEGGAIGRTILDGSDAVVDIPCSPCEQDGDTKEATKYCPTCKQNLCVSCTKYHSRITSTRHHLLTDVLNAKQCTAAEKLVTVAIKCPAHTNRDIEMYCGTHDAVCCAMCIAKNHRSCASVDDVSVAAQKYLELPKFQDLQTKLDNTLSVLEKSSTKKTQNIKSLLDNEQSILREIEDIRKQVNKHLDDLERDARQSVNEKRTELSKEMDSEIEAVAKAVSDIQECKKRMAQCNMSNGEKFVYFKLGQHYLASADRLVGHEQKVLKYTKNQTLIDAVTQITRIGKVEEICTGNVVRSGIPVLVDALITLPKSEDIIKQMNELIKDQCSTEELVEEMKRRGKRQLLFSWLKDRKKQGMTDPATHTALAQLYVDKDIELNSVSFTRGTEDFLRTNQYYDSKVVGKYCEKKNPRLACLIYERYQWDMEFVQICNENAFFDNEVRYILRRQDPSLWALVLKETNVHRRQLIDELVQVVHHVREPDQLTVAVKAFMTADLAYDLLTLLEKVLMSSNFRDHRNLQNLLILTAIKVDQSRVIEYINKLDNYDAADIAKIALTYKLHDAVAAICKKFHLEIPKSS